MPVWVDRSGMQAWVDGMAAAVRRRVAITNLEGDELFAEGLGEGDHIRFPLTINGKVDGWVVVQPGGCGNGLRPQVERAIANLAALAETRNSMADLVEANAKQWRELSVLYQSTSLLEGGQGREEIAERLLDHVTAALHCSDGAVVLPGGEACTSVLVSNNAPNPIMNDAASWAGGLEEGLLFTCSDDIERQGFSGIPPESPFMAMPIRTEQTIHGGLALRWNDGVRLTSEHLKLASLLAGQAGVAFSNIQLVDQVRKTERIHRDMELAETIQTSILPQSNFRCPGIEVACTCQPAAMVGGDAFILIPQSGDGLLAGVADVSGHGIPAALLINAFDSQVHAFAQSRPEPAHLLREANRLMVARIGTMGLFITTVLMRLESNGRLTVANAGHPPPIVVRANGETELIEKSGVPLGVLDEEDFAESGMVLDRGTFVVAYSDGVTEALAGDGRMYGMSRLIETVRTASRVAASSLELKELVLHDLRVFTKGVPLADDLTLMVIRRT